MNLEQQLNYCLERLLVDREIRNEELIACIDLTLLDELAALEAVSALWDKAITNEVAAVCMYLKNYEQYAKFTAPLKLATVINFPHGMDSIDTCIQEIIKAADLGINEIDYVFPYQQYLAGNKQDALSHCHQVAQTCAQHNLCFKIIMETGAFPDMATIYQLSSELIPFGVSFLKTSTGKIANGASLAAAFAMLSAIKEAGCTTGLKVSGGVKTPEQARAYARLAELVTGKKINADWFRIGASSLLDSLI